MKAAIIIFPGVNRDKDMRDALRLGGYTKVESVFHKQTELPKGLDLIVLPGGFSYGDHLRTGALAALSPVMQSVTQAAEKGVKVFGVCNGFQTLCEARLLPGILTRNQNARFICDLINLRVENNQTSLTNAYQKSQVIRIPVAHAEGNYYAPADILKRLNGEGRVLFRYCSPKGETSESYNLNGSCDNIAGISNEKGNVFGMMPHPENACFPHQQSKDGQGIFKGLGSEYIRMPAHVKLEKLPFAEYLPHFIENRP